MNQISDGLADKEWTKDQLRLLHQTLTQKLRLADTRRDVNARAGSGIAVLQQTSSSVSSPVRSDLHQHSGSIHNHGAGKTDTVAADAAVNGDTTSFDSYSTRSSSQDSAAHSTGGMSPCAPGKSPPSASNSSPTYVRHKKGISISPGQQHPKDRSDKPAKSQRPHRQASNKSRWPNRSPNQSERHTAEHSIGRTRHSSPARSHSRSSLQLKGSVGKHKQHTVRHRSIAGSSPSPARCNKASATGQPPEKQGMSIAKHSGSNMLRYAFLAGTQVRIGFGKQCQDGL